MLEIRAPIDSALIALEDDDNLRRVAGTMVDEVVVARAHGLLASVEDKSGIQLPAPNGD